jgi:hypothetical protein
VTARVVTLDGQRITTAADLMTDLRDSIRARGWDAGVTLAQFYDACLKAGATPQTPLRSIEYGVCQGGTGRIVIEFEDEGIDVKEIR